MNPIGRRAWIGHLALAGWTLLATLYRGYGFAVGDQNLYLPFVLKWADPQLFPNDYLLSLGYARESVTWIALSFASRLIDLELLAGLAYFLTGYLTLWAVLRLAEAWWKDRLAGWIAVLLWTPVYQLPGSGMNTVDPYVTGRGLAYALCFLALSFLVRDKRAGVVICLCSAAFVHSVSIIPFAGAVGLYYLFRREWKAFGVLAASMAATALALLTMASAGGGHDLWARYDPGWYAIALQGASCLFPTAWNAQIWGRLILYASLCAGVLALGRWRRDLVPWPVLSGALVLSCLLLWAVSWAGAAARVVLVVQLSLMRSCLLLILLLSLLIAGWGAVVLRAGARPRILALAFALGAWVTDEPALQAAAIAAAAVAAAAPLENTVLRRLEERGLVTRWTGVLALVAVVAGFYGLHFYAGRHLPWSAPGPWILAQVAAMACTLSLGWVVLHGGRLRRAGAVMAASFGLALLLRPTPFAVQSLGQVPGLRMAYGIAKGHTFVKRKGAPAPLVRQQLAEAVKASVPVSATVIVPAGWDSFRVATSRASFVTLEDMIPAEFSREFAMEWRSRMAALYGEDFFSGVETLVGAAPLESGAVMEVAGRYPDLNIRYIVTTRRYPFAEVAEAGGWRLYRISPTGVGGSQ